MVDFLCALKVRFVAFLCFRKRVVGAENLPDRGPAILCFNHTSLIDRAIIQSALGRRVWFYDRSPLRWWPIIRDAISALNQPAPEDRGHLAEADQIADRVLKSGGVVAIFPEGRMTRMGQLLPFGDELGTLVARHPTVPIVPGYLHGTWFTIFSFYRGAFWWKRPKWWRGYATVVLGKPLAGDSPTADVRQAVTEASADAFEATRYDRLPIHRQMIYTAKRFGRRLGYADSNTPAMNQATVLMRAVILKRLLERRLDKSKYVGVFLPSSVGGAMANIALTFMGRIPVNLNYTIGQDILDTCVRQAGITQVLTSKMFLDKVGLTPAAELIHLEGLRKDLRLGDKLAGLVTRIVPGWFIDLVMLRLGSHTIDDTATIVFSSGSTGDPKGVVLTHHNIACNAEQMIHHTNTYERDVVLGTLPFFHSFGYTVTLWVPPVFGCGSVFHFNPLEAEAVGKLGRQYRPTLFFTTSTFLRNYVRKCEKDDFSSMRMLVCGAEKLQSSVARDFEEKFGFAPLEGFGCTELSPVVSVNNRDYVFGPIHQVGCKRGTIGHAVPGMAVSIRDIESHAPLPLGAEGLLFCKGPNVMKGYLDKPQMTAEAIKDGWYNTGDIACVDEQGFIRITDRLSRFSKIGGEMVPHGKIEERMHEILDAKEQALVVVGVPDKRKGERLVVVHTELSMSTDQLWAELKESGVPSIWLPSKSDFVSVDHLPVLGTGKIDLRSVKRMANEKSTAGQT